MSGRATSTAESFSRRGVHPRNSFDALAAQAPESSERARQQTALRLLQQTADEEAARFALPTLATAGDVREVVRYLKKKPAGVSVMEAVEDVRRRVFEPRKIAAYEMWGLVRNQHGRLLLTPLGREFARRLEPEASAYRALLRRTRAYHEALRWMDGQRADIITHTEVVDFWQQLFGDTESSGRANEGHVVCFFHLCQAAGVGAVTVGKRGQPARLRLDREELNDYLESTEQTAQTEARSDESESTSQTTRSQSFAGDDGESSFPVANEALRILVSASANTGLAGQVETTLALAGNDCELFVRSDADSLIPQEAEAQAMRGCDAAVIIVSSSDYDAAETGATTLRQGLIVQIAAAVILYGGRVALLWQTGLAVPPSLENLRRFEFENDVLTWEVGIGLLKAAKDFQKGARRAV